MPEFRVPPLLLTGPGSAKDVGPALRARGYKHALIVTDPFVVKTPSAVAVLDAIRDAGLQVTVHDGITTEPTVRMADAALDAYRQCGADAVVGLGGGSPMDTAKAVAVLAVNPGPLPAYEGADKVPPQRAPLACIATTAGTGSEVTRYTVITDEARDRKMLISSWQLLPDIAVADSDLTMGLPPRPTVASGVDALTHAIESYLSKRHQPLSDSLALSAIRRVGGALRRVYQEPDNRDARQEMALGALEAGISFCNSSVALVHGMARPLGAHFGIAHGISNATLLARVSEYTAPAAAERFKDIGIALGLPLAGKAPADAAQATVEEIAKLCSDLDVPSLRGLGVDETKFNTVVAQMAADALASGSPNNNPRVPTQDEIVQLYRASY
jgi:alcohol dehydrogenase class IV